MVMSENLMPGILNLLAPCFKLSCGIVRLSGRLHANNKLILLEQLVNTSL